MNRNKLICIGWILLSSLEAEKHRYSRIIRKLLEDLEEDKLDFYQTAFINWSSGVRNRDFRILFFRDWFAAIGEEDERVCYIGGTPLLQLLDSLPFEEDREIPPIEFLSDLALEKGFCMNPQTNPGAWPIRKVLKEC